MIFAETAFVTDTHARYAPPCPGTCSTTSSA
jgi:hypothetical protein